MGSGYESTHYSVPKARRLFRPALINLAAYCRPIHCCNQRCDFECLSFKLYPKFGWRLDGQKFRNSKSSPPHPEWLKRRLFANLCAHSSLCEADRAEYRCLLSVHAPRQSSEYCNKKIWCELLVYSFALPFSVSKTSKKVSEHQSNKGEKK